MPSFCKFTIGTPGASAAFMLYASRQAAVLDRSEGVFLSGIPEVVANAKTYGELRGNLEAFAWTREASEQSLHRKRGSRGIARSHYRCVLSFEREITTPAVRRLVNEWLASAFPNAVACGFLHRNTEHAHVHVWFDARGKDGKKLDFSYKAWRQISASWDRVYSREMAREGRLTAKLNIDRESPDDKGRVARGGGGIDRSAQPHAPAPKLRAPEKQAIEACLRSRNEAIREAQELRDDLARMGERFKEPIDAERAR